MKDNYSQAYFEVQELASKAKLVRGRKDLKHLRKYELAGLFCTLFGYISGVYFLNPFSAYLVALGNYTSWMMAHYVLHGAYNGISGIPKRLTSFGFAYGFRRYFDWLDWIDPKAWKYEHNTLHHINTSQRADPDNIERLFKDIRKSKIPVVFKYLITIFISFTWKWSYYAPSTFMYLTKKQGRIHQKTNNFYKMFNFITPIGRQFWIRCILPYATVRFILIPLLFLPFGYSFFINALMISLLGELLANFHSFLMIGPNHTANDLHRFLIAPNNKVTYMVHQIYSTTNYSKGKFLVNFWHGYMNYHIEHHILPNLTMLEYYELSENVKNICLRNNLPYLTENVFTRFKKMFKICVGSESTLIYEPEFAYNKEVQIQ